jgi:creatinine amidohydrolase
MRLESLRWPETRSLGEKIFLLPLGSLEQHGPHLPLNTDTAIITEIAQRVDAANKDRFVLFPTLWTGHSPHHRHFACVSLDVRPYMDLIVGVCRSLIGMGARRIFLLNGHGGNDVPCKAAMRELKSKSPAARIVYATYWQLAARMAADNAVRSDMLAGRPYYVVNEFDEISASGVTGMPSHASPEKGDRFLEAAVEAIGEFLPEGFPE